MKNKNKYEIIIYGRGGQGAKTTAEVLAQAALLEGKNIQAFPDFGPERSGAPVRSFVRISDKKISTHEPVVDPDCILILDDSLLNDPNILKNIQEGEPVIINSKKSKLELHQILRSKGHLVVVDANEISQKIVGQERPNTVILGKFSFVTEMVQLRNITTVFHNMYYEKIGSDLTKKNIEAIKIAYSAHD